MNLTRSGLKLPFFFLRLREIPIEILDVLFGGPSFLLLFGCRVITGRLITSHRAATSTSCELFGIGQSFRFDISAGNVVIFGDLNLWENLLRSIQLIRNVWFFSFHRGP